MPILRSFTCFPQLPTELRLLVWKQYALPVTPILYFSSHLSRWCLEMPGLAKVTNTARSIMRVSREARAAILGHRVRHHETKKWHRKRVLPFEAREFHQGHAEYITYGIYDKYLLANWERDVFHLSIEELQPSAFSYPNHHYPPVYGYIQNLVIHIFDSRFRGKRHLQIRESPRLQNLFRIASYSLSDIIRLLPYGLVSVRNMILVIDYFDFKNLYRQDVPSSIPSMEAYNHHHLRSTPYAQEYEFGFIPIPAPHDLKLGFEHDPQGYAVAEKWHRDTLVPLVDNLVKETRSRIAAQKLGRQIDVRMAVAPAVRSWVFNFGQDIHHFPVA
ncbi:hypothetical protein F4820DRAFT_340663 [Hypoxylon rubiginosum]|uniref:Uncharacterized protein n=1 Tax=Hypoxylon rubiginosum TaxID=110542 RepID=A0ACB9YZV9_9PEZI|nr:hypothetical protein F4820DRAFT_340663 [Hypoxylon rubiginosum]